MRPALATIILLWTICSAAAMGERTIVVDSLCKSTKVPPMTPALRKWLREQCDAKGRCKPGVPGDLVPFIQTVSANNVHWREVCLGN